MSAYEEFYYKTNWQNNVTPINQGNLNHVENGIKELDTRVVVLSNSKLDPEFVSDAIIGIEYNPTNGNFTLHTMGSGDKILQTELEKVVTNFELSEDKQHLILHYADGRPDDIIDLSAFITEQEFEDSETIAFSNVNHNAKAVVKSHSIGEEELRTDYLAEIKNETTKSQNFAITSKSYAVGNTGSRFGEDTDNAKYYKEQAETLKNYTQDAVGVSDFQLDDNGNLVYENNAVYLFTVDGNGYLNYEVNV